MKPVINDKTVLRLQKATGQPVSRGMDKTINTVLDQLEVLKTNNKVTQDNQTSNPARVKMECFIDNNKAIVEEEDQKNGESQNDK